MVAAGAALAALRARKDASEIEMVRAACALVEDALTETFAGLRPGAVERDVNARTESPLRARGATDAHPLISSARTPPTRTARRAAARSAPAASSAPTCRPSGTATGAT